jgi:hypothetical protein
MPAILAHTLGRVVAALEQASDRFINRSGRCAGLGSGRMDALRHK